MESVKCSLDVFFVEVTSLGDSIWSVNIGTERLG